MLCEIHQEEATLLFILKLFQDLVYKRKKFEFKNKLSGWMNIGILRILFYRNRFYYTMYIIKIQWNKVDLVAIDWNHKLFLNGY